jgi:hypothetical protein
LYGDPCSLSASMPASPIELDCGAPPTAAVVPKTIVLSAIVLIPPLNQSNALKTCRRATKVSPQD